MKNKARGVQGGKRVATPVVLHGCKSRKLPPPHENSGPASFDRSRGNCASGDPDALFVQGAEQNVAKRICKGCPVRYDCLADALDNRIEFGIWGGMTERERRALLRRHPHVTSWKKVFDSAIQQNKAA